MIKKLTLLSLIAFIQSSYTYTSELLIAYSVHACIVSKSCLICHHQLAQTTSNYDNDLANNPCFLCSHHTCQHIFPYQEHDIVSPSNDTITYDYHQKLHAKIFAKTCWCGYELENYIRLYHCCCTRPTGEEEITNQGYRQQNYIPSCTASVNTHFPSPHKYKIQNIV